MKSQGQAVSGLRLGVVVWHFGWAGFVLLAMLGMLFLPVSLSVIVALLSMAMPGVCCVLLLSQDNYLNRRVVIWAWTLGAAVAVSLTGGLTGPLAAWVAMPMVAAVVLNQRVLISLGATLAFVVTLLAAFVSLWQEMPTPGAQASLWLSLFSVFSLVVGLGVALLPALRVRVERAVDAEEARARLFRMLTEQPALIVCLDTAGRMVSAFGEAPAGVDLKGLRQVGLSGAAHVPDRVHVTAALETALRDGRSEVGFTPHAGLDHYVALSLRKGEDGRLYGVMRDASLQHAHEAGLEAARGEAEALNQGKTRFVASMSHELRTPLNAVIGFSDIMRQQLFGELSPKYTEYAQLIWESGQHVLDLINDILDMSKIEAQKYELSLEVFDIREPVSQALRLLRAQAHDKGIEIVSQLPPGPLSVQADRRAVKQICLNLLANALKFTPREGHVGLDLRAVEGGVSIIISDTGIGIGPEDLQRIGQPYEQGGPAEQRAMGTGLGLSIVKAMAHLLGGRMSLHSVLGEGTRVTVVLPRVQVEADPDQPLLPLADPLSDSEKKPEGTDMAGPGTDGDTQAVVQSLEAFVHAAQYPVYNPLEDIHRASDSLHGFGEFVIRPPKS
ncbi:HAMP domain-containing sensor histidine kinase [Asticcacaulis sp. EMRT-3]|uniref:HAMP domain-containing sensor histidine kinase n=1 Tax=Asticcacaulis sp. EMRT-3 TaxID=3040349 RepID=UPI0024AF7C82|nr:HAMP domain-containing sensor histidine kinase [Asticcacaulis sp. EMRT-3]MDI7775407.1 HAMP domain-containing sensor histidine kinase [Asticcacaulis sp. EMRT-3]